jgi:hypothetical protein
MFKTILLNAGMLSLSAHHMDAEKQITLELEIAAEACLICLERLVSRRLDANKSTISRRHHAEEA